MAVERQAGGTSLIDVLERVLVKGVIIDPWVGASLAGIDLITVEARVVVASAAHPVPPEETPPTSSGGVAPIPVPMTVRTDLRSRSLPARHRRPID